MTDAVAIALIGGTPLTIAALVAAYSSIKNGGKADVIIGHVNSEKTALLGKLAGKDVELAGKDREIAIHLERINELRAAAGLLAQATATRSRESTAAAAVASTAPAEVKVVNDAPIIVKPV